LAWTVIAEVDAPVSTSKDGLAEMMVVVALTAPGVNDTVGELVIAAPPMVPVMVAVPVVIGEVKVAV
jgi:hypothetical protein